MLTDTALRAPDRSYVQRMEALELANETRSLRAGLKRQMKAGERAVSEVIAAPPAGVETMKVLHLLLAQPKVGRVKANRMLSRCGISPSKTVGGLSERQRCELLSLLPAYARSSVVRVV